MHEPDGSRVVLPPADEPGIGETLGPPGGFDYNQDDGRADNMQEARGMEVDVVEEYKPESDLNELFAVITRDVKKEVAE